ncbi:MAG: prephenate dehydrogenase [Lachnospiraceae bacterium]|uniref:Prephenate dehydrogenase n=1 Tax=Candidatus Weimeria bifida TaxID=2599074 RepID=A0A6N7IWM3_9FIRM|nr:prephenate dehydrogenase [Candidatus Weimeria bifida]RRF95667.1 MAG: prephenate dehydrogenase [Lachnospiraceae bacterium]
MNFNPRKIVFVGLGLIGGSVAKAIHATYPDIRLYATAGHKKTVEEAHADGLILNDDLLSDEEIADADVIFLCSPVLINIQYLSRIKPYLNSSTLITDVGSVKNDISREIDRLGLSDQFIGGHPMTGSENTGYSYSDPSFLENAYYLLTYQSAKAKEIVPYFDKFISSLGAVTMVLEPKEHDFAVACISHLPHVISASLVNLVKNNDKDDLLKTIAAGGFKDITRISSSSPVMWENICLSNKDAILKLIDEYEDVLDSFKSVIESGDGSRIREKFQAAKDYRDSLPIRKKTGILPSEFVIYSDLRDEPGEIACVATLLASSSISIKNIGLIHNREFEEGVLSIELYSESDYEAAFKLLKGHGYVLHKRS